MSTIRVKDKVKRRLFSYTAELQAESGRKVSLNDAIEKLPIVTFRAEADSWQGEAFVALWRIAWEGRRTGDARMMLRELRRESEKPLERKYVSAWGNLVLDTSILVEYLTGSTPCGEMVRDHFARLGPEDKAHLSFNTISADFKPIGLHFLLQS